MTKAQFIKRYQAGAYSGKTISDVARIYGVAPAVIREWKNGVKTVVEIETKLLAAYNAGAYFGLPVASIARSLGVKAEVVVRVYTRNALLLPPMRSQKAAKFVACHARGDYRDMFIEDIASALQCASASIYQWCLRHSLPVPPGKTLYVAYDKRKDSPHKQTRRRFIIAERGGKHAGIQRYKLAELYGVTATTISRWRVWAADADFAND